LRARLYLNCTRFGQFQRQERQGHHDKSVTCVFSMGLWGSNPTLSAIYALACAGGSAGLCRDTCVGAGLIRLRRCAVARLLFPLRAAGTGHARPGGAAAAARDHQHLSLRPQSHVCGGVGVGAGASLLVCERPAAALRRSGLGGVHAVRTPLRGADAAAKIRQRV
jgi:hypothetical protein